MPKTIKGSARPPKARTSGQSATAADEKSLHAENDKTAGLANDTIDLGEVMTGNQGVKISDDQNSLKAGVRGPTLTSIFAKKSPTLITSVFPSASSTRVGLPRTASFRSMRIYRTSPKPAF